MSGAAVVVGVDGFGEFGHLADEDAAGFGSPDAAAVVEAAGEVRPLEGFGVGDGFGAEDVAAAEADVEVAFGVKGDAADFGGDVFGEGDVFEGEVVGPLCAGGGGDEGGEEEEGEGNAAHFGDRLSVIWGACDRDGHATGYSPLARDWM